MKEKNRQDIKVGDMVSFQDANNPAIGYGRDIIGFDKDGNPLAECNGKTIAVKPEQINTVFKISKDREYDTSSR